MAFAKLSSSNFNFSFLLKKNPATPVFAKPLRLGSLYGYYENPQTFCALFKDSETEISYKTEYDQSFEYLDKSRYVAALFINDFISEFMQHVINKPETEKDTPVPHVFEMPALEVGRGYLIKHFETLWPEFRVEFVPASPDSRFGSFRVSHDSTTLREFLSYLHLFGMCNSIRSDYASLLDTNQLSKYLRCFDHTDPPYFIRYLIKTIFLPSPNTFGANKEVINKSTRYPIEMTWGNTAQQRLAFVKSHLPQATAGQSLYDIGCGEGRFFTLHSKFLDYHAWEIDPEVFETATNKATKKELPVKIYNSVFKESPTSTRAVALLIEVIEHMPEPDALALVTTVLSQPNIDTVFITTPNKDFNQFYNFEEEEKRHEDHHFEWGPMELEKFIKAFEHLPFDWQRVNIGDTVNNIPCTFGLIARRKK